MHQVTFSNAPLFTELDKNRIQLLVASAHNCALKTQQGSEERRNGRLY